MKHYKSQSLDTHLTGSCKENLPHNTVFLYLRDRKLRNRKPRDSSVRQALSQTQSNIKPQVLYETMSKKQITSESKYDLLLQLLHAKIKMLADYTYILESKMRAVSNSFSTLYSEYCECPGGKQTALLINRLRQQLVTNLPPNKSNTFQHELASQIDEAREKFAEIMKATQEKTEQQKQRLKTQIQKERFESQTRLQSSIEALSYNNRIMNKLQKGENQQVRTELHKYQQLKRRHFDLITENQRIKANSLMKKLMTSTPIHKFDEEHDTATDSVTQE